ncbi:hypothetical protein GCM10027578_39660 [Spirosoma luteolum]
MKTPLLLLLTLVIGVRARAQLLPVLDQNPTSLRWYQLNTPHFRILYPAGFDSVARQTASRLERLSGPVSASLGKRPRPVSVLLQNQSTVSNAFVTLYPRRSEFGTTPPQDPSLLGTYNWLDQLSVHEFRHVVQDDKALQHYGRVLFTLLGNTGLYVPLLTVPDWFAEGDAVGTETLLSTSGRGRIPAFDLGMRANERAGLRFSYSKAVGGSFRDNVPNHYVLGYVLTNYLKRTYGPDRWSRVLDRNYRRFPWFFRFSKSVADETATDGKPGLSVEQLYDQALTDASRRWAQQQAGLRLTLASLALPVTAEGAATNRPIFTSYQHPQYLTDSTLVCVKSGLGDTPRLVLLQPGRPERLLHVQGFTNDPGLLSATPTTVSWIEYGYDPRWGQRTYSNVRLLDLRTGHLTRLTHRSRYTAVALSPDSRQLVVVDNLPTQQTRLRILDARTGTILRTLPNPDEAFYQHPRWQADGRSLVVVWLKNGRKTLQQIDLDTGQARDLLPRRNDNLSHPQPMGTYVLFNSPRSGIDNLYAVDTRTGQTFQVSSRPLGAYHATLSPSGRELAFDDFAATGARIARMPADPAQWTPLPPTTTDDLTPANRLYDALPRQDSSAVAGRAILADTLPAPAGPPARRFSRLGHLINPYAWGPVLNSTGQQLTVGVSSQDLLSTTQIGVGVAYDQAERVGSAFAQLSYQGLYPVFDLSFQRGSRNTSLYIDRATPLDSLRSDRWQYNQLSAGMRLPLQLTNSRYIRSLTASAFYNYLQVTGYDLPVRSITEVGFAGSLNALAYGLSIGQALRQSKRDVAPRWAQALSVSYRYTPFGGRLQASQLAVAGSFYVPGLGKHHSLRLRGGYQQQGTGDSYRFGAAVVYPRGLSYISAPTLTTASADYLLPLADTHWSAGRWLYVQRLKGALFYDLASASTYRAQSAGADLSMVFNVLRVRTTLEVGVRAGLNVDTGQPFFRLLLANIGF